MAEMFTLTGCDVQDWVIMVDEPTGRQFWDRGKPFGLQSKLRVEVNGDSRRTGRVWFWSEMGSKWILSTIPQANHYFQYHGLPLFR